LRQINGLLEIKKPNCKKGTSNQVRITREILKTMQLMWRIYSKIGKYVKARRCHSFKNKNAIQDNLILDTLLTTGK
jgi:hypothetical protein